MHECATWFGTTAVLGANGEWIYLREAVPACCGVPWPAWWRPPSAEAQTRPAAWWPVASELNTKGCHLGTLGSLLVHKIHMNIVFFNCKKSPYTPKRLLLAVRLFCLRGPYGERLLLQHSDLQMLLSGNAWKHRHFVLWAVLWLAPIWLLENCVYSKIFFFLREDIPPKNESYCTTRRYSGSSCHQIIGGKLSFCKGHSTSVLF